MRESRSTADHTCSDQLLERLAVVHARGVIHRDIKPGNIPIHDGVPKLADFGVAHVAEGTAITVEGRQYEFRIEDRTPPLRSTPARVALDAFLSK